MSGEAFAHGILDSNLRVGVVSSVSAVGIKANLAHAGNVSGSYIQGSRHGRGEVGEVVLIEGQQSIVLGRIIEVRLPDSDRSEISQNYSGARQIDAIGFIQLLGSIDPESLKVQAGIACFPRLGDRIFSAPMALISRLPQLMRNGALPDQDEVVLTLGVVSGSFGSPIQVTPDKLFGRHCAILGSTGGGKSWTTSKILEECCKFSGSKILLIDATGEYRTLCNTQTSHFHIGKPLQTHRDSREFRLSPTDFLESDFIAMFEPSGKVQGPKLREAIRSLRLAALEPGLAQNGVIKKIKESKSAYRKALNNNNNSTLVDKPSQKFDVTKLIPQIIQECCFDEGDSWGNPSADLGYCSTLFTRIQAVLHSSSFASIFGKHAEATPALSETFDEFWLGGKNILRLCVSSVSYEFYAREIIANAVGRKLLTLAREERFINTPLLAVVDEAHNFLGKSVGSEETAARLDAFEVIAKEGRKYGLNICLATQRPRDITEGVLSQMGTLIVHRLTNDRDREVVERACGEIDKSAAAFLPNLKQGEATLIGVDFPIPMTIHIGKPGTPPKSEGPNFQEAWRPIGGNVK